MQDLDLGAFDETKLQEPPLKLGSRKA